MFAHLHQQLCETGSFQKAARNRDRTARTELNEEIVLDMVETTPQFKYTRPFHSGTLQQRIANPFLQPPCCSQMRRLFERGDYLIGPYILPDRLTGPRYLIFLEQVLPELLDSAHVTAATRTSMWFQQDGAPAHFSISVRNHLDATCGERWIGRGGQCIASRSPDLSCLDYFFWGKMKSLVYETPVNSIEELASTHQCRSRGNTKHSRNVIECSALHEEDVKPASHAAGRQFEHLL
ncbi:uncharacterized protein TNCV_1024251 [Trichonephila clavipes]|nr:uncharacterized protein TNCV_1024251 [Trichonephila clavipes]